MQRDELEHIIRAAGAIISDKDLIIVGSQSILGQFPGNLPVDVTESMEADILPLDDPTGRKGDMIEGAIGFESPFWDSFKIWAHGVEESTVTLPKGWRERLIPVSNANTWGVTGHCLEVHDLIISKYVAGREKDMRFCSAVIAAGLVNKDTLRERLRDTDCTPQVRQRVESQIESHFSVPDKKRGSTQPHRLPGESRPK
jgi:hypothetical protein